MNTMFYVVCIVAIVLGANTIQQYLKMRHRKEEGSKIAEETQAQMDRLEERIKRSELEVLSNVDSSYPPTDLVAKVDANSQKLSDLQVQVGRIDERTKAIQRLLED